MAVKVIPVVHPHGPSEPHSASPTLKLCKRFRTARLRALQEYPDAFSSKYEDEEMLEETDWLKRLVNRDARTFVAVESYCHGASGMHDNDDDDADARERDMNTLIENEWIGMVVLLGPRVLADDGSQSTAPWTAFTPYTPDPPTLALAETENKELAFLAVSMFVLPEMRGRGIGPRLIQASLDYARQEAAVLKAQRVNVALWVEEENKGAMRCYEKCGFGYLQDGVSLGGFGAMGKSVGMARVMEV